MRLKVIQKAQQAVPSPRTPSRRRCWPRPPPKRCCQDDIRASGYLRWDWTAQLSSDPARIAVQMIEATSGPSTSKKAVITMEIKSNKWELFMCPTP
jgi:hypothetical protein